MSQDIFNARIARINNRAGGASQMAHGDGTATSIYSSPVIETAPAAVRSNVKPMLMGLVLGMIVGALVAGLENPAMPWGPGTDFNQYVTIPAVLALCAGPVMAIAASTMRLKFPSFFFFAAAYFPAVVGTSLVELPLF